MLSCKHHVVGNLSDRAADAERCDHFAAGRVNRRGQTADARFVFSQRNRGGDCARAGLCALC